jgi:uncharacterized membrane protein YfcA
MPPYHYVVLFIASMLAGAINSVAGGGTLLTFPALNWVLQHMWGMQLMNVANATSTVALWPGQLSSLFGYRKEIGRSRKAIIALGLPSLIGGGAGAILLSRTPNSIFAQVVPYLILLATLLFMAQGPISRRLRSRSSASEPAEPQTGDALPKAERGLPRQWLGVMLFQLFVAIYGGYFGAGIGILMLAALGFMGFTDIHRMNGLKNINGLLINAVAIAIFVTAHTLPGQGVGAQHNRLVDWPLAGLMAVGAIIGGYTGAGTARRIGQQNVRRIVILIGFSLTLLLLLNRPENNKSDRKMQNNRGSQTLTPK